MSQSVVRAIKQSLADQLLAQSYFALIPVFVVIPKDIMSEINKGLLPVEGGQAIFIEAFAADEVNGDVPGPYYPNGRITVSVVEQPTLNDPASNAQASGLDCDEVSETAQRYLQLFAPLGGREACTVSNPSEVETDTFSIRRFTVRLPVGFRPIVLPAMPAMTMTPNGGAQSYPLEMTMALASSVPGAAIFYTTDGSFPSPGRGQLYTSAITLSGPGTIRARAYLASYSSGADTKVSFS